MSICSVIIRTLPENVPAVEFALKKIDLCEVHFKDNEGRIVVTVEAGDPEEEMAKLDEIKQIRHVLSVDLVYATSDPEATKKENSS
jgi:nitrate reductase NapD